MHSLDAHYSPLAAAKKLYNEYKKGNNRIEQVETLIEAMEHRAAFTSAEIDALWREALRACDSGKNRNESGKIVEALVYAFE